MSRFSLSAAAIGISTEKYSRVCVFGCKRVSESNCEALGIYNYLAGILFQQDCEVNKPAGEERRERTKEDRKQGEGSSARTLNWYNAGWQTDRTRKGGRADEGGDAPIHGK